MRASSINLFCKLTNTIGLVSVCICVSILSSCSSNDEPFQDKSYQNNLIEEENELDNYSWHFSYKGNFYSYEVIEGEMICDDVTRSIIAELQSNPNLITKIDDNQNVTYLDNEEDVLITRSSIENVANETYTVKRTLTLYEDKNCKGHTLSYELINTGINRYAIPNFHSIGWGDRISSFRTGGEARPPLGTEVVIDFYEDADYKGNHLKYSGRDLEVRNLKDVPLYPGSKKNWGDRISSMIFQ